MNLTNALGWTLIHFLWEGALISLLLALTLSVFRHAGSRVRYAAGCAALTLMLISAAATFLGLQFVGNPSDRPAMLLAPSSADLALSTDADGAGSGPAARGFANYLPILVWAWIGGVVALSIRSLGGLAVAERFARRQTSPAEAIWNESFAALAKRLRISRPVRLLVSARAQVPAVVGWLRPVVLMPARVFTGLAAEQIEALLAHELAHVRRHDYLVNLLQTAAETLFFYHPGVWWVNRTIRNERENCCDDLAVEICGNPVVYIRALTELEQMRRSTPRLAMAADGGSLLSRVQRLLRPNGVSHSSPFGLLGVMGIVVCLLVAGLAASGRVQKRQGAEAVTPQPTPAALPAQAAQEKKPMRWLDEIESEGYRNLDVDQLIRLKEHEIDGAYIRQIRAAGFELSADELIRFREHDISTDYITEMRQAGFPDLTADDLIRLREHDVNAAVVREIRSLGYADASADDIIRFREHDITPEFIREVRDRFKDITFDQLIRLKEHEIFK